MKKLDLNESLVNIGNSILKRFNTPTFHQSYEKLDKILERNKDKNVCLVLYDGLGKNVIEAYKKDIPWLYNHVKLECKSIYPPTTVAATNALLTAKYPIENGFIGWNQYFKDLNAYVDVFLNKDKVKKEKVGCDVIETYLKPTFIFDLINNQNKKEIAKKIQSIAYKYQNEKGETDEDFEKFFEDVNLALKKYQFVYAYNTEPDHNMHSHGIVNLVTKKSLIYLEGKLKFLVENNPNTLFLLIGDHGFMDLNNIQFNLDKELLSTLNDPEATFSLEGRFASFKVKDEDKFLKIYKEKYADKFELKTKEELLKENVFGIGEKHPLFDSFLGNYFLLSNNAYTISTNEDETKNLVGGHGGISDQETTLYLSVFNDSL